MTATIRAGYAGPLVTGVIPAAVGINAPVTVTSRVAATISATITAPVQVGARPRPADPRRLHRAAAHRRALRRGHPGARRRQRIHHRRHPVAASSGSPTPDRCTPSRGTTYWSGTAWVAGTTAAFITAPGQCHRARLHPGAGRSDPGARRRHCRRRHHRRAARHHHHRRARRRRVQRALENGPYTVTLEDTVPRLIRTSIGDTAYVSALVTRSPARTSAPRRSRSASARRTRPAPGSPPPLVEVVTPAPSG
jgi:hypothetical protein